MITKLYWAQRELRRVADHITPAVAPGTAKKIRSALKSIDGAIRHAERRDHDTIRHRRTYRKG